jgi:RNA polymerase sigma-70 factor (ECF subfamily)
VPESEDDARLIARARRGDREAFGALYERHLGLLRNLAQRILNEPAAVEDVVHEVFLEAWRKVRRYDAERGSVRAWLVTLLRSRAIDVRRARGRRLDRPTAEGEVDTVVDQRAPTADASRVHVLLGQLSHDHRQALLLTYFGGFTMAEAAERESVAIGTMKARVHRAVARLRDLLGEGTDRV